jgi:hypothetical protein
MEYLYAFAAGFISTLTFHQGTLFVLHKAGLWPKPPWPMTPTEPLKIPAVISLALWGGVWGLPAWYLIRGMAGADYWIYATAFGAIGPSLVALYVVFPLKGLPMGGGWNPKVIGAVLALNAAWGLGVAVLMRLT